MILNDERYVAFCVDECCWQASSTDIYNMSDKADAHTRGTGHRTDVMTEEEWEAIGTY